MIQMLDEYLLKIARRGAERHKRKEKIEKFKAFSWFKPAMLHGSQGHELTTILVTRGCRHQQSETTGCTMCGYFKDSASRPLNDDDVIAQFQDVMKKHEVDLKTHDNIVLKIFNSGSFLDPKEISKTVMREILSMAKQCENIKEIAVESRPEFINEDIIQEMKRSIREEQFIEVGIGLETWNDTIRQEFINKGFLLSDFTEAHRVLQSAGVGTKVYLFLKPLFLNENIAIGDLIKSINHLYEMGVSTISINPAAIHEGTIMSYFWNKNQYRPPWLWSVMYLLYRTLKMEKRDKNTLIICDPVAGGKRRGAHNCNDDRCNESALAIISQAIAQQKPIKQLHPSFHIRHQTCNCVLEWMDDVCL